MAVTPVSGRSALRSDKKPRSERLSNDRSVEGRPRPLPWRGGRWLTGRPDEAARGRTFPLSRGPGRFHAVAMRPGPLLPVLLTRRLWFPDPRLADAEGLVAVGGDFSPARLLLAYRSGIFPWTDDPITWWSPDPRAVIELDGLHVPRSLAKVLRRDTFKVTVDRAFRQVMEGCAEPAPGREASWVTPRFIAAYSRLHEQGHAHSVECWLGERLVGGIYGVSVGGLFAGESMFHRVSNASKVALVHLVHRLRAGGFELFDIQMLTSVTRQLGGVELPRTQYLKRLAAAVALDRTF